MKKLIVVSFMLLVMVSSVFALTPAAAQKVINAQAKQATQLTTATTWETLDIEGYEPIRISANTETIKAVESVFANEQIKELIGSATAISIEQNGDIVDVKLKMRVYLFGFFPVTKRMNYIISEDGVINRKNMGLDFLYIEKVLLSNSLSN